MTTRIAGLLLLVLMALAWPAAAQTEAPRKAPFGVPTAPAVQATAPRAEPTGFLDRTWAFVRDGQREMSGAMSAAVRRLKSEGSMAAAFTLATVSFIYGVLHAVGPGHGKFVISAYALATERTARRATLLSFMAALIQALSAIAIVGAIAVAFRATSVQIRSLEAWLETISWGLIALFGAWLLFRQWRPAGGHDHKHEHHHSHEHAGHAHHGHGHHDPAHAQAGHTHEHHGHGHDHAHRGSAHHGHGAAGKHDHAAHAHAADACAHCGHSHLPSPAELEGAWSWGKAWSLAFAIGIRPCTGAIAVLVLAGSIGLFWAGVLSAFAMAIGTALTVSVLASLAVGSRELAARLGGDGVWAGRVQKFAAVGGSALVFVMGVLLCIASIQNASPL